MTSSYLEMAFWLLAGHALGDFALQTQWLSSAKNHLTPGNKNDAPPIWPLALGAHGVIHGAIVAVVTGSVVLGSLETISHMMIDYFKSDRKISFHVDQALHVICKILWLAMLYWGVV